MDSFDVGDDIIEACFAEAENGLKNLEVPVGCVFVRKNNLSNQYEILATAHNRSNEFKNALKHAEMNCINHIVQSFPTNYMDVFRETVVVLTLEPCIMCCRALRSLRVKAVLFGAANDRFGGAGSVYNVHSNDQIQDEPLTCISKLDSTRAIQLLQQFYDQTNYNAPQNKIQL